MSKIVASYQDLLKAIEADELADFLVKTMDGYMASQQYKNMKRDEKYYAGENPLLSNIAENIVDLGNSVRIDIAPQVKISSGFLKLIIGHLVNRIWFYPVEFDNHDINEQLGGNQFRKTTKDIATNASIHGVCYGFWEHDKLKMFKATEYLPFPDERNGTHMAGLRFWQLGDGKPWVVQLFQMDGFYEWSRDANGKDMSPVDDKGEVINAPLRQSYRQKVPVGGAAYVATTPPEAGDGYTQLPIIPLYTNAAKTGENTPDVRSKTDAYDALWTIYGDQVLRMKFIYWMMKGLGGDAERLKSAVSSMNKLGIITLPEGDPSEVSIDAKTINVPHAAHMANLEQLAKEIYRDAQVMHPGSITGGSLTNVAILTHQSSENIKVAGMQGYAREFIQGILEVSGIHSDRIDFKEHTISNDKETTDRLTSWANLLPEAAEKLMELDPEFSPEFLAELVNFVAGQRVGMDDAAIEGAERRMRDAELAAQNAEGEDGEET